MFLSETIGLWFVECKLNIPIGRESATMICYQFAVIQTVIGIVRVPYMSIIISYEKMDVYAMLSIIEAILKVLIVVLLPLVSYDRLILFSVFTTLAFAIISAVYIIYCRFSIIPSRYTYKNDKLLLREMFSYSGWSLAGGIANLFRSQGLNVLFNLFFSVVVNAAMGIANQVSSAVNSFMSNFSTAYSPQIVKLCAEGDNTNFYKLVTEMSKLSFALMTIICIPLLLNINLCLDIWLNNYPEYTIEFCVIVIVSILVDSFSAPLWTALGAIGKIRTYYIILSITGTLVLPVSYLLLKCHYPPTYCLSLNVLVNLLWLCIRLMLLKRYSGFSVPLFIIRVLLRGIGFFGVSYFLLFLMQISISNMYLDLAINGIIEISIVGMFCYILYLDNNERDYIVNNVKKIIRR